MENSIELEKTISNAAASFNRLYKITETLRGENGCPWDKKQTPLTLRETFIEETFEVIDAISDHDSMHAKEELGDAFFNVILIAYCYEQEGAFTVSDVLEEICQKLERRHPHVFGNSTADTSEAVVVQWEKIKDEVEGRKTESVLDSVPASFPPLLKAYKFLKKAAKKGFVWPSVSGAEKKVLEEFDEVKKAAEENDREHLEEEIGDLLLAAVNLSHMHKVDPNAALERALKKFEKRFRHVEKRMDENKPDENESEEERLEKLLDWWKEAKKN